MRARIGWIAVVVVLGAMLVSPAKAQTPTPLMFWQYGSGEVLAPYGADAPKWRVLVGPSPIVMPRYEGSKHYRIEPGIAFDVRYKERLFFGLGEGLGYDVFRSRNYRAGLAITYDTGRSDHPSRIHGLGDISPAPEGKLYGEYVFRPMLMGYEVPVMLQGDVRKAVGGYGGIAGDLGLYMPVAGSEKKRAFVFVGPAVSFANDKTMHSFFSVREWQSRRSGLPTYRAQGGLRNAGFGISAGWFFTPHWLLSGDAAAKRLLGDAVDSPIVERKWQFTGGITLAYMWF